MVGSIDKRDLTLYGGRDPRDLPAYSLDLAARLLLLPFSTLKAWVFGQSWKQKDPLGGKPVERFFEPLITPPDPNEHMLSFVNLVEAHVLKAVRRKHFIQMDRVRSVIDGLKKSEHAEHPLADVDMLAGGGSLYTSRGVLVDLTMGKQITMEFLKVYLNRIDRTLEGAATRLFPFVANPVKVGKRVIEQDTRIIAIDPYVSFGRPIIDGTGIPTDAIADRFWGGDSVDDLVTDFQISKSDVEYALRYENAQSVSVSA
jgi:uncharacterized protein (DUF433 family)